MSEQQAISLYSGRNVPSELSQSNAAKLLAALNYLGNRHVLKTLVPKKTDVQQFILKAN